MKLCIIGSYDIVPDIFSKLDTNKEIIETSFGNVTVNNITIMEDKIYHINRNSESKHIPPHAINYKANILALKQLGITDILATAMVGSLRESIPVGTLTLVTQFLDFTKTRDFTLFNNDDFAFVDMTDPYCKKINKRLLSIASELNIKLNSGSCYLCNDGPRFETRAEVSMYRLLGGDIIGMTNLPECIMAREAGICYSVIAGIINMAAGLDRSIILASEHISYRKMLADPIIKIIENFIKSYTINKFSEFDCNCKNCGQQYKQVDKK